MAAYCGASIAGSDPIKTGFSAWRLALAELIVAYVFVYNPVLLINGSIQDIIISQLNFELNYTFPISRRTKFCKSENPACKGV